MSFLIYPREDVITSGSGRSGDNRSRRQPSKRGSRDNGWQESGTSGEAFRGNRAQGGRRPSQNNSRDAANSRNRTEKYRFDKNQGTLQERPKWTTPELPAGPLPSPNCPWCGKPIKDISSAIADKGTGEPLHFDCVLARLAQGEILEKGDAVSSLGGGRFGVVHFSSPPEPKGFFIKKIFEWENKDDRAEWRGTISDHYSVT